jgi:hypothetical protein
MGSGMGIIGVVGSVVVVVVGGGPLVDVVVISVVVVVGGDFRAVVVVVVGDELPVVVVVEATVGVLGRESVVVVVGTTGVGLSSVAADVGAVAALVLGVPRADDNVPACDDVGRAPLDFACVVLVVVFGGVDAAVVVEVAEAVLGAASFAAVDESPPESDGNLSRCTNPT